MSIDYDNYITLHVHFVQEAFQWIRRHILYDDLIDILPSINLFATEENISHHDFSKLDIEEYDAYDQYFYGGSKKDPKILEDFNYAWLHHIHSNPHHWQHWVLIQNKGGYNTSDKIIAMDMPDDYILEMICDWWSFSFKKQYESDVPLNTSIYLYEVFKWYDTHKSNIIFSYITRKKVDRLLSIIRKELDVSMS